MGAVGHGDSLVVHNQIWMVVHSFGGKTQADNERDGLWESREGELAGDCLASEAPTWQFLSSDPAHLLEEFRHG